MALVISLLKLKIKFSWFSVGVLVPPSTGIEVPGVSSSLCLSFPLCQVGTVMAPNSVYEQVVKIGCHDSGRRDAFGRGAC